MIPLLFFICAFGSLSASAAGNTQDSGALSKPTTGEEAQPETPAVVSDEPSDPSLPPDELNTGSKVLYTTPNLHSIPSATSHPLSLAKSNASDSLPLLQSAPPTKHPIERKSIKIATGYTAAFLSACTFLTCGSFALFTLGAPPVFAAAIGATAAALVGYLVIHYSWDFINTLFTN